MNRKVRIDIDTRTLVRFWLVIIGLALLVALIYFAKTAIIVLGVSFFLALALSKPVTKIAKILPGKSRVGAAAVAYVAVLIVLSAVVFLVVPPVIQQTAQFAQTLPKLVDSVSQQWSGLSHLLHQYNLQPQIDQVVDNLKDKAGSWAGDVGQSFISGIGSFFAFITELILVLFLTFFMLIEGPTFMKYIWSLYGDKTKAKTHARVAGRLYDVVTGYVTGQITVSAIGATLAGIAVFIITLIFNAPLNLAIPVAVIYFIMSLIPMFGATIGAIISALLILMSSWPAAVVYFIYFIVYQQVENNFVVPKIQSKRTSLSPLVILASVTIGLYLFGIVGGIIAIPIAGCLKVLLEEYLGRRAAKRTA